MDVLTKKEKERLLAHISDGEIIEKEVAISWDGKNLFLRFPKEMADYLDINEKNRFTKNIKFIVEEKDGEIIKKFEVVDRTKPKRETKNKDDNEKKDKKG